MIHSFLIINKSGKIRLRRFYDGSTLEQQTERVQKISKLISSRPSNAGNIIDGDFGFDEKVTLVYRSYATLLFIVAIDAAESALATIDLIHVFVRALDQCFEK
ncbi:AP-3 complex subunit sigma, partial [Kipferlia bialata]|eukprot:g12142.t1